MKLDDDDFTLFGLPQRFALDGGALDTQWRALQSQVHPDRFAAEGGVAQRVAMQWAVRVNEAYRRLKDPLKRAAYLCELRGAAIQADSNTAMPADFLLQQMAWREALEEAADAAAIAVLAADVRSHQKDRLAALAATLDEQDNPAAAAQQVRALMFVARFREDIQHRLDTLETQR